MGRRTDTPTYNCSLVDAAVSIFVNGIIGVFAGIAVLYVTMKVLALTAGRLAAGSPLRSDKN